MKVKRTARGFELIEFKDRYEQPCSLQQSSIATESCVWLGCDNNATHSQTGESLSPRMHLSIRQVHSLIGHLSNWLDHGSFKND